MATELFEHPLVKDLHDIAVAINKLDHETMPFENIQAMWLSEDMSDTERFAMNTVIRGVTFELEQAQSFIQEMIKEMEARKMVVDTLEVLRQTPAEPDVPAEE